MTRESSGKSLLLAFIYALALFAELIDTTMLNVALPQLAHGFGVPVLELDWLVSGFIMSMTLAVPLSVYFGNVLGRRRTFLWGQVLYVLSSIFCAAAMGPSDLIFWRCVQGFCAGLTMPVGLALAMDGIESSQRVRAIAMITLIARVAPTLGPMLTAGIFAYYTWPMLFLAKLPLSLCALLLTIFAIPKDQKTKSSPFDLAGFLLACSGLVGTLFGLRLLGQNDYSLGSALTIAGLGCLTLFVKTCQSKVHPLVSFKAYRYRSFYVGSILHGLCHLCLGSSYLCLGLYLQEGLNYSIAETASVLCLVTIGMAFVSPLLTRLYGRLGPKFLTSFGLGLLAVALCLVASLPTSLAPSYLPILALLIGVGLSCAISSNAVYLYSEVPSEDLSDASGLYTLMRNLGGALGAAFALLCLHLCLTDGLEVPSAYRLAIGSVCLFPVLSLLWARQIPKLSVLRAKETAIDLTPA